MVKILGRKLQRLVVYLIFCFMVLTGYSIYNGGDYCNYIQTPFMSIKLEKPSCKLVR